MFALSGLPLCTADDFKQDLRKCFRRPWRGDGPAGNAQRNLPSGMQLLERYRREHGISSTANINYSDPHFTKWWKGNAGLW